ncbi:MAG: hypothetical protein ABSG72_04915 [Candidatus Sulfotelmatobacter sp.]
MHAFTFGKDDVRTVSTNVDITGLAGKPWSLDVYSMFTDRRFEGFTVGLVLLGVCPNGAGEFAIDVEVDGLRGIVEEPNVSFWRALR